MAASSSTSVRTSSRPLVKWTVILEERAQHLALFGEAQRLEVEGHVLAPGRRDLGQELFRRRLGPRDLPGQREASADVVVAEAALERARLFGPHEVEHVHDAGLGLP
jgi:hypothetical protein